MSAIVEDESLVLLSMQSIDVVHAVRGAVLFSSFELIDICYVIYLNVRVNA